MVVHGVHAVSFRRHHLKGNQGRLDETHAKRPNKRRPRLQQGRRRHPRFPHQLRRIRMNEYNCRTYVDKPTRCYNCQSYGHMARKCKRQLRCQRCGQQHQHNDCQQDATTTEPRCLHCKGQHVTGDKACPKYQHERKVVNLQSTQRMSYS